MDNDNRCTDENLGNTIEIEDKFDDYIDNKVCVYETVISGGALKEEPCHTENQQRIDQNYVNIKDKSIDHLIVVAQETELMRDYIDDKVCIKEDVISMGYIKEELCNLEKEQESIHNYVTVKDKSIDDLTVVAQETELMIDYTDDKVCVYETLVSSGCIKQEPCDMEDESRSIYNYVNMKDCGECGEAYDLYCLKCPMLIRIFDSDNTDGGDNIVRWTLPKNFIDIRETPCGMGIVALRAIPKGVVFGPFRGLNSTKDDTVSKWKLENKQLAYTKDPRGLNWMQYIRRTDQSSHQNLISFQCKEELYYQSDCHINVDEELLVCWNNDGEESRIEDMEDSYLKPQVCEKLDEAYGCTLCCVGYKSISHLQAHNYTCLGKKNKKDFWKEIVQCEFCKIYLDKKEYSDYHMDRCYKNNRKFLATGDCFLSIAFSYRI